MWKCLKSSQTLWFYKILFGMLWIHSAIFIRWTKTTNSRHSIAWNESFKLKYLLRVKITAQTSASNPYDNSIYFYIHMHLWNVCIRYFLGQLHSFTSFSHICFRQNSYDISAGRFPNFPQECCTTCTFYYSDLIPQDNLKHGKMSHDLTNWRQKQNKGYRVRITCSNLLIKRGTLLQVLFELVG